MQSLFKFLILLFFSSNLMAQSNDVLDQFLAEPYAEYDKTVYIIFAAAQIIPEDLPPAVAVATLEQRGYWYSPDKSNKPINFGDFSYILMKALELPHGIMYGIFPTPWYASREVNFKGLLVQEKQPWSKMTPFEVLGALSLALEYKEFLR